MRSEEVLILEDAVLDETPDLVATLPELRHHHAVEDDEDDEVGMRALLEYPEALSKSLRRQLH